MRWFVTAIGLMHAACSSSATTPDAITVDAQVGGLIVELVAKGGVPQMPTPSVELRVVSLHMSTIRVLGDSAPGDMRTTRTDAEFIWQESLGAVPQLFKLAPPGVYSEVELDLGGERAIHATGYAVRGGNLLPFEIQSNGELSVNIAVNTLLAGREFATTKIEVDVASFIEDIDWDAVPITTDGRLFIGDGDSAMPGVLAKVPPAFKFVAD